VTPISLRLRGKGGITYEATKTDGKRFRNAEVLIFADEEICRPRSTSAAISAGRVCGPGTLIGVPSRSPQRGWWGRRPPTKECLPQIEAPHPRRRGLASSRDPWRTKYMYGHSHTGIGSIVLTLVAGAKGGIGYLVRVIASPHW
jgi:hypothetical protein